MPNAALWTIAVSVQVQRISLATALVEVNRLYSPQANCAMLTPIDVQVTQGTDVAINPIGNLNFFAAINRDVTQFLVVKYGYNGNAPVVSTQLSIDPGGIFLYFDPSGTNFLNGILLNCQAAGSTIAATCIVASING